MRRAQKRKFCNGFGDGLPPDGRRVQMGSGCNIGLFQFPDLLREEPRPKDTAVAWGEVEFTRQESGRQRLEFIESGRVLCPIWRFRPVWVAVFRELGPIPYHHSRQLSLVSA